MAGCVTQRGLLVAADGWAGRGDGGGRWRRRTKGAEGAEGGRRGGDALVDGLMTTDGATLDGKGGDGDRRAIVAARIELLGHVEAVLEPVMVVLGLVFLGLLTVQFSGLRISGADRRALNWAEMAIYALFVGDFGLRFVLAPVKSLFLRRNWLTAASLVVPCLRPLRAAGAAGALPSVHLLRLLSGANHGMRALREIAGGRRLAYLVTLSVLVMMLGAGSVVSFERAAPDGEITSFGQGIRWAATLVTTINSGVDPISIAGRVVAVVMRVYAVSVFGYITASIATYFIGRPVSGATSGSQEGSGATVGDDVHEHLAALRREIGALREEVGAARGEATAGTGPVARAGDD